MKRLTEQNYYKLLGISSRASFEEVRSAYDEAMSIYSDDSIATYSLLMQEERERILSYLVEAYKTLTNSRLRREYNSSLIERGEISPEEIGSQSLEDSDVGEGKLREVTVESLVEKEKIEEKVENESQPPDDNLDLFDDQTSTTGKSIKTLRTTREMSLEEIYRKTNIPKKTLEDIEEEHFEELPALVYLKGFLKIYAKILNADQSQMVDGYVKRYLEWKNTS